MNRALCTGSGQQRTLFAMAGTLTGLSALLAATVSPWFLLVTGFVALNQLAFATLGACPASLILRRLCTGGEA